MLEEHNLPPSEDIYDVARQRAVLERFAHEIKRRRLAAVAIFTLESLRPLSYIASQGLLMLRPLVELILGSRDYAVFAAALEDRTNIEWLLEQLEGTADTESGEERGSQAGGRTEEEAESRGTEKAEPPAKAHSAGQLDKDRS